MLSGLLKGFVGFLKGLVFYNLWSHFYAQKRCVEDMFMLVLFGPIIGVPHLFRYYSLRLLPYYVREVAAWKKRMVKERDFFDQVGD